MTCTFFVKQKKQKTENSRTSKQDYNTKPHKQ